MFHVLDVANRLGLTHFTHDLRLAEIFDVDAHPAAMGIAGNRPLAATRRNKFFFG
jgi:hypothetical protein